MRLPQGGRNWRNWVPVFLFAVAVIAVYKLNIGGAVSWIVRFLGILQPFFIALGLAFVLFVPCQKLEGLFLRIPVIKNNKNPAKGRHIARLTAVLTVYLLLAGLLALVIAIAIPYIIQWVQGIIDALPDYYNTAYQWAQEMTADGMFEGVDVDEKLNEIYASLTAWLTIENVTDMFSGSRLLSGVVGAANSVMNVALAVIASVYMLLERERLLRALHSACGLVIPPRALDTTVEYTQRSVKIFNSYIYSKLIDSLINGVLAWVGLLLCRIPYAPGLAVLVGITNLIPYFGALLSGGVCVLIALLQGNLWGAVGIGVFLLVMQQIDGNIIQPKLFSSTMGINPFYVLLAIVIGGGYGGFWGMFLSVPLMGVLLMIIKDLVKQRKEAREQKQEHTAQCPETGAQQSDDE